MTRRSTVDPDPVWLAPSGPAWRVSDGPRVLVQNPWFTVESYDAVAPTGAPAQYYVQRHAHVATGVVPLHADGTVTLVGQWRFPFGAFSWELPEGGAPHGETPLDGAKRELREEAGLSAQVWRHILTLQHYNSSSDEVDSLYIATELHAGEAAPDPTEALAIARPSFGEALHAVVTGRITDSLTVAALLRVHHMATGGELEPELAASVLRAYDAPGS